MIRRSFCGAVAMMTVVACATNPVSGRKELSLVSTSQEIDMGRQGAADVAQSVGLYNDAAAQTYVSNIGKTLAAKTERPDLPWEFHVVDDPALNAFALPGGFIFVTRGLMTYMNNEAELATVLGHEAGHVAARHSVQQISRQQVAQIGLGVGMILSPTIAKYGQAASAGMGLMFLKFSRDDESQADQLGFKYALADGYDVRQMANVFETLQREENASGGGKLPEWQSTHPDPGNRIQATQQRVAATTENLTNKKVGDTEYLQRINGMMFGENPRNGFFQGTLFLHPDLKFVFQFPDGWQTQNAPDAVMAASKAGDAMIELSPAKGGASAAAQQFFGQQGMQASQPQRATVHGIPAIVGEFAAQTDQGVTLRGTGMFLDYGGTSYQILGYAEAEQYPTYRDQIQRALGSFAQLTDQKALNAQPAHVRLERVPRAMTFEQFNQQFPSTIPVDEAAIMNGLQKTDQVAAGRMLKRVQ